MNHEVSTAYEGVLAKGTPQGRAESGQMPVGPVSSCPLGCLLRAAVSSDVQASKTGLSPGMPPVVWATLCDTPCSLPPVSAWRGEGVS